MAKKKIAILGSGVGSITTAFALTNLPGWQEQYDITVYTLGWRLGGKGASGRNDRFGQRIEEHGLHVWMGFYDNAFRAMQQCYQELDRPASCPIRTWTDAFHPHTHLALYEFADGLWRDWRFDMPILPGTPGTDREPHEVAQLFEALVHWLLRVVTGPLHAPAVVRMLDAWRDAGRAGWAGQELHRALDFVTRHLPGHAAVTAGGHDPAHVAWLVEDLHRAAEQASAVAARAETDVDAVLRLLERFVARLETLIGDAMSAHDLTRRLWTLASLVVVVVRGIVADGVLTKGFDAIAGVDFRDWLHRHGAGPEVRATATVRTMYDLCFAFEEGELDKPNMDAAVLLRTVLLMGFTYRGAFMYRMNAGMGDVVFGPYYELLTRRGVKFEFFHRVQSLGLTSDGSTIDTIAVDRQVKLTGAAYDPFVLVKGLPCWPSTPNFDQIEDGDALRASGQNLESHWCTWPVAEHRTLRRGVDFDEVVLGISIGALSDICAELLAARKEWRDMCDRVKTVATQGVQLWLKAPLSQLGWEGPPPVAGTFAEPLDTWADMSDLLAAEDWPAAASPQSIVYLVGPLRHVPTPVTDPYYVSTRYLQVLHTARTWVQSQTAVCLPKASAPHNPSGFDVRWLHTIEPTDDPLLQQFLRANIDPSERYVLSVAGSSAYRMRAGRSGFTNLYLTGDWVWTPINAGCVEAATMAGLDAARSVSGTDIPIMGWPELGPPIAAQGAGA